MLEKNYRVLINGCEKSKELNKYGKFFLMREKNNKNDKMITAIKLYDNFKVLEPNGDVYEGFPNDFVVLFGDNLHVFTPMNFYNRFQGY